jgi:dTDP-4-dehydrorhamnose reductase
MICFCIIKKYLIIANYNVGILIYGFKQDSYSRRGGVAHPLFNFLSEDANDIVFSTSRKREYLNDKTLYFDLKNTKIDIELSYFTHIVICAAITNLQECHDDQKVCKLVNVTNTIRLIDHALENHCFVIFLSSNLVFNGKKPFYQYNDKPNPNTFYGKLKLDVENHIRDIKSDCVAVLRMTKVMTNPVAFIEKWKEESRAGIDIIVFTNRMLAPIHINIAVKVIYLLINKKKSGIFHLSGNVEISYYEYANKLFENDNGSLRLLKPCLDPAHFDCISYNSLENHLPD